MVYVTRPALLIALLFTGAGGTLDMVYVTRSAVLFATENGERSTFLWGETLNMVYMPRPALRFATEHLPLEGYGTHALLFISGNLSCLCTSKDEAKELGLEKVQYSAVVREEVIIV